MGHRMHQPLAILCVTSSLALVTLGSADPSSGFHLQTLSFSRPPQPLRGPLGIWLPISLVVAAGVGEAGKHSLPSPLQRLRGPSRLTTITAGFEAGGRSCAPSAVLSLPPSLRLEKRKRDGNR
jgi:hypothetical protein